MKTKNWILLFAAILLLSLGAMAYLNRQDGGTLATVTHNGSLVKTIDLSRSEDFRFTVTGENGLYNIVEIQGGKIRVAEAGCPDQICVHRGWGSSSAEPIVCLPNSLVITIQKAGPLDGVAG